MNCPGAQVNCVDLILGDIVSWSISNSLLLFLGEAMMCDCDNCILVPGDAVYVCRFLLSNGSVAKYTVHYDEIFNVIC